MPRIKKDKPKLHVLFFDTSLLWHEDKALPVTPAFEDMCRECSKLLDFELVIPSTVYGELHFQQSTSALKALDRANQAFEEISTISAVPYSHHLTTGKIKNSVKVKLDNWVKDKKVRIAKVPIKSIDWDQVVKKAIWREPPFSYDPKDKKNEKGFRDALILHTYIDLCKIEKRDVRICFFSADGLLRKTAEQSLRTDNRCLFFDSFDSFSSYVRLTGEELTQNYISKILAHATDKFFRKGDETCLYAREGVQRTLREKFKEYFDDPQKAESASSQTPAMAKWQIANTPKIWIGDSRFASLQQSIYHWENQLSYVCLYRSGSTGLTLSSDVEKRERVLVLEFSAKWHAFVKADARFHDVTLDDLNMASSSFQEPTIDQRNRFALGEGET